VALLAIPKREATITKMEEARIKHRLLLCTFFDYLQFNIWIQISVIEEYHYFVTMLTWL
jgi:hypothetical protein